MARQLNKLSANEVKNAKGSGKIRKLADGGGLTLIIKGESSIGGCGTVLRVTRRRCR